MSEKKINLRIVTPDKTVVDTPVDAVGALGTEGAFTALPGHIPFLTDLKPGILWYRQGEATKELAVSGGFIEILPDKASVLADSAEYVDAIDVERAERALKRAEQRLAEAKTHAADPNAEIKTDISRAEISLVKATTRIRAAKEKHPITKH